MGVDTEFDKYLFQSNESELSAQAVLAQNVELSHESDNEEQEEADRSKHLDASPDANSPDNPVNRNLEDALKDGEDEDRNEDDDDEDVDYDDYLD